MLSISELHNVLRDLLQKNLHLTANEDRLIEEIYVSYDDQVSHDQLKKISNAEDKKNCFYEMLDSFVLETEEAQIQELFRSIKELWNSEEFGNYEDHEENIRDFIYEWVDFNFPYQHYLSQDVLVNILVDTGDGNYDFTLNNLSSYNTEPEEDIEKESALLWLAQQQGYSKEQLADAVKNGNYHESSLLRSIHSECINVTSHMNALSFFVRMPLKDFMEWCDKKKTILLSKDTPCGLYDPWNGAGGTLEIELENEVQLPWKYAEPHIEGTRGYGIDSIYGMFSKFWKPSVLGFQVETKTAREI